MSHLTNIDRRSFLKTLTKVIGASAGASVLTLSSLNSALAYERSNEISQGKVFSLEQMKTLASICQTTIPKTDTPGAADLDCHGFIDNQMHNVHTKEEQSKLLSLLQEIDKVAVNKLGTMFADLTGKQKEECLIQMEKGHWASGETVEQLKQLKSLIVFGYFTSEIGATQVLVYQPVPGGYKGSIPVTPDTKNYSSLAFY